jgi:NAD(P)-dependent dehydrogenase (short-subunit alcohol dehydrogenase family)
MNSPILDGRIALITGGSKGIGFGSAQRLVEEGAFVYITGRGKEALDAAVARLGTSAAGIEADASRKADMTAVAEQIRQRHGKLDILFANAGLGHATPFPDLTEAQIDKEIGVNFKGVILTVQSMLGVLGNGASVILNASITADMGLPGFGVYAATKAAIRSLARSWTTDLKDRDIRVNTISPGVVPTEGYSDEQGMSQADVDAYVERVSKEIPAGRVGTSREIGDALVFLASDASRYVRGVDLVVDGGMTRVYAGKA